MVHSGRVITEYQSCPPSICTNDLTHYGLFLKEVVPPDYWGETVIFTEANQLTWVATGFIDSMCYMLSHFEPFPCQLNIELKVESTGILLIQGSPQVAALLDSSSSNQFACSSLLASVHLP